MAAALAMVEQRPLSWVIDRQRIWSLIRWEAVTGGERHHRNGNVSRDTACLHFSPASSTSNAFRRSLVAVAAAMGCGGQERKIEGREREREKEMVTPGDTLIFSARLNAS